MGGGDESFFEIFWRNFFILSFFLSLFRRSLIYFIFHEEKCVTTILGAFFQKSLK